MNGKGSHPLGKGVFLIASPEIDNGMFYRGVILLCDHSNMGSFGLLINKPLEKEVTEELTSMKAIDQSMLSFLVGGPMQPGQMMLLHTSSEIPNQTLELCSGVFLGGDVDFLQKQASTERNDGILLCFGFCGWTGGLLEKEVSGGMWFTHPATKQLVFGATPKALWASLLKGMGGKYAAMATMPEDLSQN